jgi:hypothetical protein
MNDGYENAPVAKGGAWWGKTPPPSRSNLRAESSSFDLVFRAIPPPPTWRRLDVSRHSPLRRPPAVTAADGQSLSERSKLPAPPDRSGRAAPSRGDQEGALAAKDALEGGFGRPFVEGNDFAVAAAGIIFLFEAPN